MSECCGRGKHTPLAKALFFGWSMRPKAEALGYLICGVVSFVVRWAKNGRQQIHSLRSG